MGIMQLIKVKTKRHIEWLAYQFTSRGPELRVVYNQMKKITRILRQHELKIANDAKIISTWALFSTGHLATAHTSPK